MTRQLQIFENNLDRDLEVYVEMNPDRYVLRPGDVMHLAYDHEGDEYGLHTQIGNDQITIFLQNFDTTVVTINGNAVEPWS